MEKNSYAYLKWTNFTEGMDPDGIQVLADYFQTMQYGSGDRIFSAGTTGIGMGIIIEGSASVMVSENGKQKKIAVIKKNETFGELALLDDEPRSANVVADEPITAVLITKSGLEDLIKNNPDVAARFLLRIGRILARRIRTADQQIKTIV
jgi:CRP-like cAMP-binding protein